ncbi:DUF2953 domain-containing protein [Pseudalkalibacillus sp. SCS-8]|uniref:DUF2953 domain-containing protein n=1 Tax=Pseudalkalibacillus nanhaiensis TaxID=3115291 RepID=UPI0032DA324F
MYWLIGILLVISILITFLLLSRVRISITYIRNAEKDACTIHAHFLRGKLHYSWYIPFDQVNMEEDGMHVNYQTELEFGEQDREKDREAIFQAETLIERAHETKELIDSIYQLHRIIRRFLKTVHTEEFQWFTTIGTGDAASTGIFSGMLWTIKGSVAALVSSMTTLKKPPIIEVHPSFQLPIVEMQLQCMFSFRIGKAMLAAYQIVKNWKGRKQHVRTSNPGLDANGNGEY